MIVFFDTSAMVKRYIAEADSDAIVDLWNKASLAIASQLLYAESIATFARKRREQPQSVDTIAQMQAAFQNDFETLTRIPLDDEVHRRVDRLLERHALRGADAVHLASAVFVHELLQEPVTFACADARLVEAAREEGLIVSP